MLCADTPTIRALRENDVAIEQDLSFERWGYENEELRSNHTQRLFLALEYFYITELLATLSAMFTRLSICIFLFRIFSTKKYWRWGLYATITFVLVTQIPLAPILFLQCQPVQKNWNPTVQGKCWSPHVQRSISDFNGVVSVLGDWVLATLPIVFLWNVQMSSRIKAGICCLMGMGFFSGACTIARVVYFQKLYTDISWHLLDANIWGALEVWVGIIAACMPMLKPLFYQIQHSRFGSKLLGAEQGKDGRNLRLTALPPETGPYSKISDRGYAGVGTDAPQARLQSATDGINKSPVIFLKRQQHDPENGSGDNAAMRMTYQEVD